MSKIKLIFPLLLLMWLAGCDEDKKETDNDPRPYKLKLLTEAYYIKLPYTSKFMYCPLNDYSLKVALPLTIRFWQAGEFDQTFRLDNSTLANYNKKEFELSPELSVTFDLTLTKADTGCGQTSCDVYPHPNEIIRINSANPEITIGMEFSSEVFGYTKHEEQVYELEKNPKDPLNIRLIIPETE